MTRVLPLAAVLGALVVAPAPGAAQAPLGEFLDRMATLWSQGDARALSAYTARAGADLEVSGTSMGALDGRKFTGALRRIFDDHVTVSVVSNMTRAVHGVEDRAFAELTWEIRSAGATVPDTATVFLALVREPEGWRITQIRILE